MVALKDLGLMPSTRSWDRQIGHQSHRGLQIAQVMTIAVIPTLSAPFIRPGSNQRAHFFLQNVDQGNTDGLPQPFFYHLFKDFLTSHQGFVIVWCVSHWYPPGSFD